MECSNHRIASLRRADAKKVMIRFGMSPQSTFIPELVQALEQSEDSHGFSPDGFFTAWFRKRPNAYFFLFLKNVTVTNLQFAELVALIESEVRPTETNPRVRGLQFASVADFKSTFSGLIKPFAQSLGDERSKAQRFADIYGPVLERLIVLEIFSGSCAVYLPPHLTLDLAKICGLSGYIHSCGRLIFSKSVYRTQSADFIDAIDQSLSTSTRP